ncbi:beta-glucosidase [Gordonia pseudamarae]|uniref:Beta-glucosidase n=1 Tax=Gordonia pseudamarae TaxID=2831662 RepID=A0ABX6IIW7_9ACTN|nr:MULTISPECIES: glycoside hydrolase family 3 C-terminal domain-containing protein [Gordonia]MBD0023853.1 glycoside hydrolase family 3 C-terminal domain-containing protein [Gordonia sp. (in: high G+C Gram-positive bacteria)]QHN26935.1 beta-glucosidase [Gordonia pseudamarae]QHN35824.1 beta-glucosidase [Gordonia pseudamarae]
MADNTPNAADLTIEQQAQLTSGQDFWTTKSVAGVPSIMLTDGPHGLRKQDGPADHLGVAGSVPATCFPPAVALAQTWNPDLARRAGGAIADEARAQRVSVLLGPGINLKRSPLGGRNFEYFSEDPLLTGQMAAAFVDGVQSRGVGTSLKHFAANNQETDRMRVSADVDERTLHELYLRAFRHVVRTASPWTVMCSYNKINGVYSFENRELLTTILREAWGFTGLVVSDWGAVADRVSAVAAGLDLTMPFGGPAGDDLVAEAVADGTLEAADLLTSAGRVIDLAVRAGAAAAAVPDTGPVDLDAHHALAREIAAQAVVLLRNDENLLPLTPEDDIAVIGALAVEPRYQGGGSSHVNATGVDAPLAAIRARTGREVRFAAGYSTGREAAPLLADEAIALAGSASTIVLFLGLAEAQESEGFDRTTIDLPDDQIALAVRVLAANPRTVVILCHGGAVQVSVIDAPAVLDAALLGQAVGSALADVLFGDINPSGRLAETLPRRIEDTPAFLNFPGEHGHVSYGEGLFIGYRWYDARGLDVTYPFGHGLSYTTFGYDGLAVESGADGIRVTLRLTNTGDRDGREIVQVYLGADTSSVARPPRELKGFANVGVAAGESVPVSILLTRGDIAYWDTRIHDFIVESGSYTVYVGSSSRDIRLTAGVEVTGDAVRLPLTLESTIAEVTADPAAAEAVKPLTDALFGGTREDAQGDQDTSGGSLGTDVAAMMASVPLGRLVDFSGGRLPREYLQSILEQANNTDQANNSTDGPDQANDIPVAAPDSGV